MAERIFIKFGGYVSYARINLGSDWWGRQVIAKIKHSYPLEQLHQDKMKGLEVSWSKQTGFSVGQLYVGVPWYAD